MPFVPAPNLVEVEIRAISDGQHIENRIMVDALAAPTAEILSSIAEAVWDWATGTYALQLPDQVAITAVVATDLSSEEGGQVTVSEAPVNGSVGGGALPLNATLCFSLRSTSRGRSARGRLYLLALPATSVSQNTVHSAYASNVLTGLNGLIDVISGLGFVWVVASYIHDGAPRVGGPVYFAITNVILVDPTVDSQRRRLPGRGS